VGRYKDSIGTVRDSSGTWWDIRWTVVGFSETVEGQ